MDKMKVYTPAQWVIDLSAEIEGCTADMARVLAAGKHSIALQQRGYALLEGLAQVGEDFQQRLQMLGQKLPADEFLQLKGRLSRAAGDFTEAYEGCAERLEELYDEKQMEELVQAYMKPWERSFNRQQERVEMAQALHEAAKIAYEAQQNGTFWERLRTLRQVRRLAGFRLERRRVGNFVARTYDLLHDAQKELQRAQQDMFAHNISHKCSRILYKKISQELSALGIL